jgi:hypothetical protein
MKMTKANYLQDLINLLSVDEIKKSAANPNRFMSATQIKLHYLALRKLGY